MAIPQIDHLLFFTDLDGTLLDHDNYSYEPAVEALDILRSRNIPLILASSKTAAEIAPLRYELGFSHCEAIVENGAGILAPGDFEVADSCTYNKLLNAISKVPAKYRDNFRGFSSWTSEEISSLTGLTQEATELAKRRQFSEPGIWNGGDKSFKVFCSFLSELGIKTQRGGRFITLSFGGNKVDCMREIAHKYRSTNHEWFCVALGDAPNDIAMLEAADIAVVIPNPLQEEIVKRIAKQSGKIIRAPFSGPKGWNTVVLDLIEKIEAGEKVG
ncbi:MAG: HAD-IIB family hydrolase [Rhizobiaceae bacterium]|nr:HAD-IIB family hydrolase [Rhizobiaceae bacterium]